MSDQSFPNLRKKSPAARTVKHVLKDGTVKVYRYARHKPQETADGESLLALLRAYERSPEWAKLAPNTKTIYSIYLRPFLKIGHLAAKSIDRRGIIEIRNAIAVARGPGAATGFVRAAAALFSWAVENDWLGSSAAFKVKGLADGHLPAWTQEQADEAVARLPEHLARAVTLALYTGQRRGDLIALRWTDISTAIRLTQQKTGEALALPIHPTLAAELARWRIGATAPVVLTDRRGKPWNGEHLSAQLPHAMGRLGLPRLGIHGLRKLAAARLAEAGCTEKEIASVTGHRTLQMVALYTASASQERLANTAMDKLTNSDKRQKTVR